MRVVAPGHSLNLLLMVRKPGSYMLRILLQACLSWSGNTRPAEFRLFCLRRQRFDLRRIKQKHYPSQRLRAASLWVADR